MLVDNVDALEDKDDDEEDEEEKEASEDEEDDLRRVPNDTMGEEEFAADPFKICLCRE